MLQVAGPETERAGARASGSMDPRVKPEGDNGENGVLESYHAEG